MLCVVFSGVEPENIKTVKPIQQRDQPGFSVIEYVVALDHFLSWPRLRLKMPNLMRQIGIADIDRSQSTGEPVYEQHNAIDQLLRLMGAEPAIDIERLVVRHPER